MISFLVLESDFIKILQRDSELSASSFYFKKNLNEFRNNKVKHEIHIDFWGERKIDGTTVRFLPMAYL